MTEIKIIKRIHHHWIDLFRLVLDVESYPAFVPYCRDDKLLWRKSEGPTNTIIVSRMTIGLAALQVSYANRTVGDLDRCQIRVEAIDGPLRHLRVVWNFNAQDDDCTQVEFAASYEFSSPILTAVASRVFESMFREIIDAFERRADALFARVRSGAP